MEPDSNIKFWLSDWNIKNDHPAKDSVFIPDHSNLD